MAALIRRSASAVLLAETRQLAHELFSALDADGDSRVTLSEMRRALHELQQDISEQQVCELFAAMDVASKGFLLFDDFMKGFAMFLSATHPGSEMDLPRASAAGAAAGMSRVRRKTLNDVWEFSNNLALSHIRIDRELRRSLREKFEAADSEGRGWISRDEFSRILLGFIDADEQESMRDGTQAKKAFSDRVDALWESMDRNHDGKMTFSEFLLSYAEKDNPEEHDPDPEPDLTDAPTMSFDQSVSQERTFPARLHRSSSIDIAREMFEWIDENDDGFVDLAGMQHAAMYCIGRYLTEEEYETMFHMMSVKGSTDIPFDRFALLMKRWSEIKETKNDSDSSDCGDDNGGDDYDGGDGDDGASGTVHQAQPQKQWGGKLLIRSSSATVIESFCDAVGMDRKDLERALLEARDEICHLRNANRSARMNSQWKTRYMNIREITADVENTNETLLRKIEDLEASRISSSLSAIKEGERLHLALSTADELRSKHNVLEEQLRFAEDRIKILGSELDSARDDAKRALDNCIIPKSSVRSSAQASAQASAQESASEESASEESASTELIELRREIASLRERNSVLEEQNKVLASEIASEDERLEMSQQLVTYLQDEARANDEQCRRLKLELDSIRLGCDSVRQEDAFSLANQILSSSVSIEMGHVSPSNHIYEQPSEKDENGNAGSHVSLMPESSPHTAPQKQTGTCPKCVLL